MIVRALVLGAIALVPLVARAAPTVERHEFTIIETDVDIVGDPNAVPAVSKAFGDTLWIADWNFDGSCVNAFDDDSSEGFQVPGWLRRDFRILNDGNVYWHTQDRFDGAVVDTLGPGAGDDAVITGNAKVLTHHDLCWAFPDGYGANWYQAIRLRYVGDSYLSFIGLLDTESGFDFYTVETDSACASASFVNYDQDPQARAQQHRDVLDAVSGFGGIVLDSLALFGYGTADTHCVYIAFSSDGGDDQEDGHSLTTHAAALVIDNIVLEGGLPATEDFDGGATGQAPTFVNLQDATPFGVWTRVYQGIADNDVCTSNPTCAWLDTDHTSPTFANDPSQAFGPGGFVAKNWRDTILIGPWVSLLSTPGAPYTVLSLRRFPGNNFSNSRLVQNWSVRGKTRIANTDTPAAGDSIDCVTAWGHAFSWNSLSVYSWVTLIWNMSSFIPWTSREVQVRFRNSDWRRFSGISPPVPFRPGPGPFWDRVKIGRRVITGPSINEGIDARFQAQDGAPTNGNESGPYPGPDWAQDSNGDIFGTTAFSRSQDGTGSNFCVNLIQSDSITIVVTDVRGAGGIASVDWYGRIVRGPHAGKAPPGYTVGPNGFFCIPADTAYGYGWVPAPGFWAVDMDDTYFRGGDEMHYFWFATDGLGGATSDPVGLNAVPADYDEAVAATGGLFEVSYLPTIDWAPEYLARVAADAHGDLEPTQAELDHSSQANCILYNNIHNIRRRSGPANRSSFMATLDELGYADTYDVYDQMGLGYTKNALGSRMTVAQARYYALIVFDAGNLGPGAPIIPDGSDCTTKIDMDTWLTEWLQASGQGTSLPNHTLWLMGSNWAEEGMGVSLQAQARVALASDSQPTHVNPIAVAQQSASMVQGCAINAPAVSYALDGGCPNVRDYDALLPLGQAVETHTYDNNGVAPISSPGSGLGAIVVHADAAFGSNTIMQAHPWADIRDLPDGPSSPQLEAILLAQVLACVLPPACQQTPDPATDVAPGGALARTPAVTVLHAVAPNPFNPSTRLRFDLARPGHVRLGIYDAAGRLVVTLLDKDLPAGEYTRDWAGVDTAGRRVSSGVYFCRFEAPGYTATRKLVPLQ